MVDAVVMFEEDTPLELIKLLMPDVLVKGGDYTVEQIAGAKGSNSEWRQSCYQSNPGRFFYYRSYQPDQERLTTYQNLTAAIVIAVRLNLSIMVLKLFL